MARPAVVGLKWRALVTHEGVTLERVVYAPSPERAALVALSSLVLARDVRGPDLRVQVLPA